MVRWSPQQLAARLIVVYPDDAEMRLRALRYSPLGGSKVTLFVGIGTFPDAAGSMNSGSPTGCVPDPRAKGCLRSGLALIFLVVLAACGGSHSVGTSRTTDGGQSDPTKSQLAEASRLLNIGDSSSPPPSAAAECVARTVVQNPPLDQVANDIAQIQNGDLRQAVMYAYLQCGYNYIIDSYMRFAPVGLSKPELSCVRSKFTQLNRNSMAEVIVLDPDAGFTGPLVIQACQSGSRSNPLLKNGALIGMGGS